MHLRVKICGITAPEDARLAGLLGADAIGLNFYAGSRRHITAAVAEAILRALPPFLDAVGLYVNEPLDEALAHARRLGLSSVQWHGEGPPLPPGDAAPVRFVPAFPVRDAGSLVAVRSYLERCRELGRLPAAILLDAHVPGEYGGTGRVAPWEVLADFRPGVPLILAGGLAPDNVAEAVRQVRPYAVDVASGVESAAGRKEAEKMRRFLDSARAAAAGLSD